MVLSGVPRKKSPVTPPGIDPGTVRPVAQCLNHYVTPGHIILYIYMRVRARARVCVFVFVSTLLQHQQHKAMRLHCYVNTGILFSGLCTNISVSISVAFYIDLLPPLFYFYSPNWHCELCPHKNPSMRYLNTWVVV